jgi:hypothetical protein
MYFSLDVPLGVGAMSTVGTRQRLQGAETQLKINIIITIIIITTT